MVVPSFSRRTYFRFLAVFVIFYTCGQFMVGNQAQISLLIQSESVQTANQSTLTFSDRNDESSDKRNTTKEDTEDGLQSNAAVIAKELDRFKRKKIKTETVVKLKNESTLQVIYDENVVQVFLKEIHEEGEKAINLYHDDCKQRLPKCLIIGNYKSGTQELIEFMFMHPRIRILREPSFELHFFGGRGYKRGLEWYRKRMPCSFTGQITVEKSPSYLQEPEAPGQIHSMDPNIKMIAMVREPIERAIAHFSWDTALAKKHKNNFTSCVIDSKTREINRNCIFIKHSIYDEGMERYLKLFNRSQLLIIDSIDFKRDPFKILYEIENLLSIEYIIDERNFVYIEKKGFFCVRSAKGHDNVACYDHRRGRNEEESVTKPVKSIDKSTMRKLKDYFRSRNERFFEQIGRRLNWQYDE